MKLVSACLIGVNCNYKGENRLNQRLFEEFIKGELYPVCPEVLGGLTIPRYAAEIKNGTGSDVLRNMAKVFDSTDNDVTYQFITGAYKVLEIARIIGVGEAVLKARSPSCGCGKIYDGSFSQILIDGDGVTTALLKKYNLRVINDEEI